MAGAIYADHLYVRHKEMKLSNWFKIPWWILVTALTGYIFYRRWDQISSGNSAPVDVFIFLVLVALLLAPIFQEISLFGLKFKQEVEKMKEYISVQLTTFKADIQTTISNSVNTNVTVSSTPPPDDKLPKIEEKIREALKEFLGEAVSTAQKDGVAELLSIDEKTQFLFRTRYLIEKNLREIAVSLGINEEYRRPLPVHKLSSILINHELLNPKIAHAIREVYSVCSPAIHGEEFTDAQFDFVRALRSTGYFQKHRSQYDLPEAPQALSQAAEGLARVNLEEFSGSFLAFGRAHAPRWSLAKRSRL